MASGASHDRPHAWRRLVAASGLVGTVGLIVAPHGARAQATTTGSVGTVRVHVVQAQGAPLADAEVAIVRGLQTVVATARTDSAGVRLLAPTLAPGDYHLVVRKLGFARVERFFTWTGRDTLRFELTATPAVQTLGAVRVEAREEIRRRKLFIDADAIANSTRPLIDATDILTRLRPDMIYGLGGARQYCRPLSNVWINGQRIVHAPLNPAILAERRMAFQAGRASPHLALRPGAAASALVMSVLGRIKPEHVAEIRAHDCGDLSLQRANAESAIFVTLKPGIRFEPDVGSYVADEAALAATVGLAAREEPAASVDSIAPAPTPGVEVLPAYRFRVLGVYDAESGQPVADATVLDVRTGARTTTSSTGTAALALLPEGGGTVRIERAGYRAQELAVVIAPGETLPITLLLTRGR